MRKRELLKKAVLVMGTMACLGLAGCTDGGTPRGNLQTNSGEDGPDPDAPETPADPTPAEDPGVVAAGSDVKAEVIDYTSEKALLDFVAGEWYLTEEKSGEDYGVFTIAKDGSCEFKRIGETDTCKGKLSFENDYHSEVKTLDRFELGFDTIPDSYNVESNIGDSSGYFHITQAIGEDFMYLEETGNGASYIAYEVLNVPEYLRSELGTLHYDMQWVFHRENKVTAAGEWEKLMQSYAFVWERDGDSVLLQWLDPVSFDEENEYTGYRFTGAVFDESSNPGAMWYALSDQLDTANIFNGSRFSSRYPAEVYMIYTDDYGRIAQVFETDRAAYGIYELMPGNQEISFDGVDITINGVSHTLEEFGNVGNAILDVTQFGDYALIEGHVNPHRSVYTILDMRSCWPVKTIVGGLFLYNEKIWDSFYSDMNCLYDYDGNLVYEADGTEIMGLSFTDGGSGIKIEYMKNDDKTYEEVIDRPECLNAPMYAYADFRRCQTASSWADFLRYAPDDALFMVMVNPWEDEAWDYYMPREIDGGGSDIVYAIALQDGTEFGFGGGESVTVNKGEMVSYSMTVPEGGPVISLYAVTPDEKKAEWPVATISGKDDTRWTFATEE